MSSRSFILPNWLISTALIFIMLAGMLTEVSPLQYLENKIYDGLLHFRQTESASQVVVVEIDDKSIREIGSLPWSRGYLASLVKQLSEANTAAIGIDILMSAREVNSGLTEMRWLRRKIKKEPNIYRSPAFKRLDKIMIQAEKRLDNDIHLRKSLMPAKNVVLPFIFTLGKPGAKIIGAPPKWLTKQSLRQVTENHDPIAQIRRFHNPLAIAKNTLPPALNIAATFADLASGAGGHGHINVVTDRDGIVRSEPTFINFQGRLYPSFALRLAMSSAGLRLKDVKVADKKGKLNTIVIDELKVPVDNNFRMLIDYQTSKSGITHYSFTDITHKRIPSGALRDKIVIIGVTAADSVPIYKTPGHGALSRTDIIANSLENILTNTHIERPAWAWLLEIILLFYFGFFMLYVASKVNTRAGIFILFFSLLAIYGFNAFLLIEMGLWFKFLPPAIVTIIGFVFILINRALQAPIKKQEDNTEMNKMLGLSFQSQGMLDMAFDNFMKCSLKDPSVKEALYNLGLDFERKRMFNKAVSVYEYILKEGRFKDITDRIRRLRRADNNALAAGSNNQHGKGDLVLNNPAGARPTLGRYEVIKEIGKGAIGTVYLGRDPKINRKVAIKILRYDDIDKNQLKNVKERFFREAEAAGRLSHPNIITIYDAGEDYDITYMAMEYIDGNDLSSYCRKDTLMPPKMALNVITRVAFALDYSHKHQVVHRDIKPANIMLTKKGNIKVTDFGIARLASASSTQTGVILGTPNYMSPEQVLGKKVDGRSDLFSLGAVLYELLTGEKPFRSDNIGTLMHNISNATYTPIRNIAPEIPTCIEQIVAKLLTKDVSQRFQSAGSVVLEASNCMEEI